MSKSCPHTDLMIHAYIELQTPYYLKREKIDMIESDDTAVIRPDMGASCQQCSEFDVSYDDWRKAPKELLTLFIKVRKDMEENGGYIEGYPLEAYEMSQEEGEIDHQLVGALLGSAWRQKQMKPPQEGAIREVAYTLAYLTHCDDEEKFFQALYNTMRGCCYSCGSSSEVRRDRRGVYCCSNCSNR
ncbi:MAG TPA: hypothetical protein VFA10_16685 [Ktedonobacteraceae bacterium]|nr:hypothetical protein [Ktedonobacteraceae bacterium]